MRSLLLRLVPVILPAVQGLVASVIDKTGFSRRDVIIYAAGFATAFLTCC